MPPDAVGGKGGARVPTTDFSCLKRASLRGEFEAASTNSPPNSRKPFSFDHVLAKIPTWRWEGNAAKSRGVVYASEQGALPGIRFMNGWNRPGRGAVDEFKGAVEVLSRQVGPVRVGAAIFPAVVDRVKDRVRARHCLWVADSLSLREFIGYCGAKRRRIMTVSRTRRLLDEAAHQAAFDWVLTEAARRGLLKGKTIGIDATT
jgi:hypothetical protein